MDGDPFGKCKDAATYFVTIWLGAARADFALCSEHATNIESFCRAHGLDCRKEPLP